MRLLLTRPEADAARTAAALRARGHEAIVAPLLRIEILPDAELGAGPWAAILVTSANAVRAIAGHERRDRLRGIAVFAVGAHSAQDMRAAGFADVTSADGNVTDLADLVAARMTPASAAPLSCRRGALRRSRRRSCAREVLPCTRRWSIAPLSPRICRAMRSRLWRPAIDGVFHFSRRSAEAYVNAARKAGLGEAALTKPVHFCLSARIAEPLLRAGAANVRIAARPEEAALIALCG